MAKKKVGSFNFGANKAKPKKKKSTGGRKNTGGRKANPWRDYVSGGSEVPF